MTETRSFETDLEYGVGEILVDEETLRSRVAELGAEVSADYHGRDLLLIGVLKGAVFFMADLMRHLTIPCEVDFMAISSYGDSTDSSGIVRILKDLDINIEGRDVLVVEDIIDSGLTLSYLMRNLESREPATLEVCALADQARPPPDRRSGALRRLRDPGPVRRRLRPRLRRAVPESSLRRGPEPRAQRRRALAGQRRRQEVGRQSRVEVRFMCPGTLCR